MKKLFLICLSVLFLLVGCQLESNQGASLNDVLSSFEKQNINLKENKVDKDSVFGTKLNGVKPSSYLLNNKSLYIYIYDSSLEKQKGLEDFNEKTALMNIVSFIVYEKDNVLIFYVHEQNLGTKLEIDGSIKEAINNL